MGLLIMLVVIGAAMLTASCDDGVAFEGRKAADMSGYPGMKGVDEVRFVETNVKEVARLMKQDKPFAFFVGYEKCKFCDRIVRYINDAAIEAGMNVGYIDTRKDPEWKNNTDIDNYDKFVELFGDYLEDDENGEKYLFTPQTYFIDHGEVSGFHNGVVPGYDDPEKELTESEQTVLRNMLKNDFNSLKS